MDRSGDVRGIKRQAFGAEMAVAATTIECAQASPLRVGAVALSCLLQNCAFGPDDIERMTTAYQDALRVLGLADRTDPITEMIAKKIVEVAQTGERDPLRIRVRAIANFGLPTFMLDQGEHSQS